MNITKLKMKDLMEVEELSGVSISEWDSNPNVKVTLSIAYVMAKKDNPKLTWEEVLDWDFETVTKWLGEDSNPKALNS